MKFKLKICGMKQPDNISQVVALHPDYLGFIFYPGSKRFIQNLPVSIIQQLPEDIKPIGVFVDEHLETLISQVKAYALQAVQLHGQESVDYCLKIKQALPAIEVIKAFGVDEDFDFETLDAYTEAVDYYLFDTQTPAHGGSGKRFNWSLLNKYKGTTPYFLSGGIGLEEAGELLKIEDPRLYAVDVNSRFEVEPGLKNIEKLKEFIQIRSGTAQ
jgi:phosphoribosylanthranilate isomerase